MQVHMAFAGATAQVSLKFGYTYDQDLGPRTYTSVTNAVANLPTQLSGAADLSIQVGVRPILRAGISATASLLIWTLASGESPAQHFLLSLSPRYFCCFWRFVSRHQMNVGDTAGYAYVEAGYTVYTQLDLQQTPQGSSNAPANLPGGPVQIGGDCSKTHVLLAELSWGVDDGKLNAAAIASVNVGFKGNTVSFNSYWQTLFRSYWQTLSRSYWQTLSSLTCHLQHAHNLPGQAHLLVHLLTIYCFSAAHAWLSSHRLAICADYSLINQHLQVCFCENCQMMLLSTSTVSTMD